MNSRTELYERILKIFNNLISVDIDSYECEFARLLFPTLSAETVSHLCHDVVQVFMKEDTVLKINQEVVIVGDIHGHILDLFRIFKEFGMPPSRSYLFLGDFVDRGEFSTECMILVFVLKILYPDHIQIIRGNHEFTEMWMGCGFKNELDTIYPGKDDVKFDFQVAFAVIPLAAIVFDTILCVHGGIGPNVSSIKQINNIDRPINDFENDAVATIVWSDPSETIDFYKPSNRGSGFFFGTKAITSFLESVNLKVLVRGHECVDEGVEYSLDNKLITVFSASNYCGVSANGAGVLVVRGADDYGPVTFSALRYIKRSSARFTPLEEYKLKTSMSFRSLPTLKSRAGGGLFASQSLGHFETLKAAMPRRMSVQIERHDIKMPITKPDLKRKGPLLMKNPRMSKLKDDGGRYSITTPNLLNDGPCPKMPTMPALPAAGSAFRRFSKPVNAPDEKIDVKIPQTSSIGSPKRRFNTAFKPFIERDENE